MTQADVAAKLNVTQQAVACWEAGHTAPTYKRRRALARVFNVPVVDIEFPADEQAATAEDPAPASSVA